jgi:hypothetical protein
VNSRTTDRFWKCYSELPESIKKQAKEAYQRFIENPYHPGLRFKRIHSTIPVFSVRITIDYRAIGLLKNNEIIWFWIGSHSEYEKMVKNLRKS